MRIGYDLAPAQLNSAGERRYTLGLYRALLASSEISMTPLALTFRQPRGVFQRVALQAACEALYYPLLVGRKARREHLELIHYPRHLVPKQRRLDLPTVLTVNDLFPLRHPELYSRLIADHHRLLLAPAVKRATRIITGSRYSQEDIVDFLGIPAERVKVTRYGLEDRFRPTPRDPAWLERRFGIEGQFVVCVGTLEPRKNLQTALDAFDRLSPLLDDCTFVLTGAVGWKSGPLRERLQRARGRVITTGYVEDEELVRLLGSAACFVHPALFEGFGFPVLEAMACGTPVVSSNGGSLAEVVADAGMLVDPLDAEGMAAAIEAVLTSQELSSELRDKGLRRATRYTWQACARATIAIYREALAAHGR